jgi:hypothetical protein
VTDNLPGTDIPRGDAVAWLKAVGPVYLVFGLSGIAVTTSAAAADLPQLVVAAAAAGVASLALGARLKQLRAPREMGRTARVLRVGVAVAHLVVGLLLVLVADSDSATFIGIAFLAHFGTEVLSEARYSRRWMVTRGYVGYALALLLIVLGLGPIGGIAAPAGLALVVFGVAAAAVSTELHTEDWLDVHRSGGTRSLVLRGGFALVGTVVALLVFGIEPAYVGLIVAAMLAVVALVASDSDTGVLLVLALVALVWALAPRAHEEPAVMQPEPGDDLIVAFGDSFISGEGASEFIEGTNDTNPDKGNQCRRAPTAYPVSLVEQGEGAEIPDRVLFLACSGAVARDLWAGRPSATDPVPQLTRYRDAMAAGPEDTDPTRDLDEGDVAAVLISMGGNDAGFGEIGKACIAPGDCSAVGARFVDRLEQVEESLDRAYTELADELAGVPRDDDGNLPVYVMAYPMPVAGGGCWWTLLSAGDHDFIRAFVDDLNDTIQEVAERHDFRFVASVESSFIEDRLRICDRATPSGLGMNFIALNPVSGRLIDVINPQNWIHNSLHPNARGHEAMRETVQDALAGGAMGANNDFEELSAADVATPCPEVVLIDGEPSGEDRPAQCDQATFDWVWSQTLRLARHVAPMVGLGLVGAWLLLLPLIRRAQRGGWTVLALVRGILPGRGAARR